MKQRKCESDSLTRLRVLAVSDSEMEDWMIYVGSRSLQLSSRGVTHEKEKQSGGTCRKIIQ